MSKQATWYFDFISPFAYLQLARFKELPDDLQVEMKPVVFGGLLKHWGQLGPAEMPTKRVFVYRMFKWIADKRGVPFTMPPSHPYNPLHVLRLAIAAGITPENVRTVFHHIYGEGRQPDAPETLALMADSLGLADWADRIADQAVKDQLKANTDEAIAAGVFGVPTFVVDGEVFWGDDATDMLLDYLQNPALFASDEMKRLSTMPMGFQRSR